MKGKVSVPNFRPEVNLLLLDFGGVHVLVLVLAVKGVKQSQVLLLSLRLGFDNKYWLYQRLWVKLKING